VQLAANTGNVLVRPQLSAPADLVKQKFDTWWSDTVLGHSARESRSFGILWEALYPSGFFGLVLSFNLISLLGFILHELAHKYVAQGYGLWAEFRLNMTGLLLTAISIVSPIKFIAPGL